MSGADKPGKTPWGAWLPSKDTSFGWQQLDHARAFLHARNPDAAVREAAKALEDHPDGMIAYFALDIIADAFWMKRDHMEVWAIGERMIDISPDYAAAYIQIARGALVAKEWRRFDEITSRALEQHPNNASLMQLVGIRWRTVGGYDVAEEWARAALAQQPHNTYLKSDLAVVHMHKGRHDEARAIIDEMLEQDPDGSAALSLAALEAYRANRFADAATLAALTLERDPDDGDCRIILARSRILGHWFMKPAWLYDRYFKDDTTLNYVVSCIVAAVITIALVRFGGLVPLAALVGYAVLSVGVIAYAEYRYRNHGEMAGTDAPQVSIKDY